MCSKIYVYTHAQTHTHTHTHTFIGERISTVGLQPAFSRLPPGPLYPACSNGFDKSFCRNVTLRKVLAILTLHSKVFFFGRNVTSRKLLALVTCHRKDSRALTLKIFLSGFVFLTGDLDVRAAGPASILQRPREA